MIHLIQPTATSDYPQRQAEYNHVKEVNASRFPRVTTPNTRSFKALFNLCDPRYINVIANADIIIENSVHLHSIAEGEAWALSRWEDGQLYNHKDSQDVWIVRGRPPKELINLLTFDMGVPGCDNRLAWELQKFYRVSNPSKKTPSKGPPVTESILNANHRIFSTGAHANAIPASTSPNPTTPTRETSR